MEYKLAYSDSPEVLHKLVNDAIAEGYEPIGGVSIAHCGVVNHSDGKGGWVPMERFQLCQAMTKPTSPNPTMSIGK